MKKIIFGTAILSIIMLSSCSKSKESTSSTWSFKGKTTKAYGCVVQRFFAPPQFYGNFGLAAPTTLNSADSNYAFMSLIFADTTALVAGTYTVAADDGVHLPGASQVFVHLRYGPTSNRVIYYGNGMGNAQKVYVSFTSTGHATASANGLEMQNQDVAFSTDKSNLNFNLVARDTL